MTKTEKSVGRRQGFIEKSSETPSARSPSTIPDVARAAGVSRSTAARVIGGYGYTSISTRAKVLEAAERLGYRTNHLARSMATGRTLTIGVILADIENLFFAQAARAISDAAKLAGFHVMIANTDEDVAAEREAVQVFLDKRVDGMIVAPASCEETEHLAHMAGSDCPLVLLDRRIPSLRTDSVAIDNFAAAHEAVSYLVAAGHKRIALASAEYCSGGRILVSSVAERVEGYRAALKEAGIALDKRLLMFKDATPQNLTAWRRWPDRPTAVLATDSIVALNMLQMLSNVKLRVPRDLSLIVFDNANWTSVMSPRLTVISQPVRDLGRLATEMLIERMTGSYVGSARETLLFAELLVRNSVQHISSC